LTQAAIMRDDQDPKLPVLRGLVTEEDLPLAEEDWPGLREFFRRIPSNQRPVTFLDLVWRFECWRSRFV
jgi:hypothetical protein